MNHVNLLNANCGGSKSTHYLAKSLGAPFDVYLADSFKLHNDPVSGKESVEITDLPGLIAAVVRARVLHPRKLSGEDMKFVRTAVCLKSKVLADAVDLSPEHYSRCESGQKAMSPTAEKIYRGYVFLATYLKDKNIRDAMKKQEAEKQEMSSEDAKKAISIFQKLFFEMKINPLFDSSERLEFVFWRGCKEQGAPCDEDGGKWKNDSEIEQKAA